MDNQMPVKQYTEDQRDCLQEICNIATGCTADVLARQLNSFVTLPIPIIKIIDANKLPYSLMCLNAQSRVYTTSQVFVGSASHCKINGQVLMLLSEKSLDYIDMLSVSDGSHLQDICLAMVKSCLDTLSEQWEIELNRDQPTFFGISEFEDICQMHTKGWKKVLMVEMHYQLESKPFSGNLLLLFPDHTIMTVAQKLDDLLDY